MEYFKDFHDSIAWNVIQDTLAFFGPFYHGFG